MTSSLDKLVSYPPSYDITTRNLQESGYTESQIQLLTMKGTYPYDRMISFSTLNETSLPEKGCFYSKLTESPISDEAYKHAQDV